LSSIEEKLDLITSVIRELAERLEKLEKKLEQHRIDSEELRIALELASAFSTPLIKSLEMARTAYEVLVRLGKPDPITRAIVESLSDCSEKNISEIYRGVKEIRGRASRRIISERVRALLERGVVVNIGTQERPRIKLSRCIES